MKLVTRVNTVQYINVGKKLFLYTKKNKNALATN